MNDREESSIENSIKVDNDSMLHQSDLHQEKDDWKTYSQLNQSLTSGEIELAKECIKKASCLKNKPYIPASWTRRSWKLAINLRYQEIIQLMLEKGLFVLDKNSNDTLITLAAKMEKYQVVDILLTTIDSQNFSNKENLTHLHVACMRNCRDIVKNLLQHEAEIDCAVKAESIYWPGFTSLHFAVQFEATEVIELLLQCNADITIQDARGLTPIHLAFILKREKILDLLLLAHRYEVTNPVGPEGLTHFHIACSRNNTAVVESFIAHGVDWDCRVQWKFDTNLYILSDYRPLNFAIEYECLDVIKLLLQYVDCDCEGLIKDPVDQAIDIANKSIVELILASNDIQKINKRRYNLSNLGYGMLRNLAEDSSVMTGYTPLHVAVALDKYEIFELLILYGSSVVKKDFQGRTPLHLALEKKRMRMVNFILDHHFNFHENPVNNYGLSHFHISCMMGKLNAVEFFIELGVDVNQPVSIDSIFWPGNTALHFTALYFPAPFFQLGVINLLLISNANSLLRNGSGSIFIDTFLALVEKWKEYELYTDDLFPNGLNSILSKLTDKEDMLQNDTMHTFSIYGFSSLHILSMTNEISKIESFLQFNPNKINLAVNWPSSHWDGFTALHFAVYFGNSEVIKLLLRKGANCLLKDASGYTPLHIAFNLQQICLQSVEETNTLLLYSKENLSDRDGYSCFHIACSVNNIEAAKYYIKLGVNVNEPVKYTAFGNSDGLTPLHIAVKNISIFSHIQFELVELLIEHGANVNARDNNLESPLHCIDYSKEGSENLAKILFDAGADINARNLKNETPLLSAITTPIRSIGDDNTVRIQFLLDNGADIDIQNVKGLTALKMIQTATFRRWVPMFLKHIKKMQMINYHVGSGNMEEYLRLRSHFPRSFMEIDFSRECAEELEVMKNVCLGNENTLYSIFLKKSNQMALLCQNAILQDLLNSKDFHEKFPLYGYLIHSCYLKGLSRKPLLDGCKKNFINLSKQRIPVECTEMILNRLGGQDLKNVLSASSS